MKKVFVLFLVFLLILSVRPEVTDAKNILAISSIEKATEQAKKSSRVKPLLLKQNPESACCLCRCNRSNVTIEP
jgi:hypothetical protein